MIHLFKKVYIETDQKLDLDENRIVISENNGHQLSSYVEDFCMGKLYYFSKSFDESMLEKEDSEEKIMFKDFFEFLNFVDKCYEENKEPLYIYVDQKSFNYFIVNWYKILFPNIDFESFSVLLRSYLFYNKIFGMSRNSKFKSSEFNLSYEEIELKKIFNSSNVDQEKSQIFVNENKSFFCLEFLLSSYYFNNSCLEELINPVSSLLKKIIENEMYEMKERVYMYLNNKKFLSKMQIDNKYELQNIEKLIEDKTPLFLFFNRDIWTKTNLLIEGSSKGTINYSKISDDDIEQIFKIRAAIEMEQEENDKINFYNYLKNIKEIISCIKYFRVEEKLNKEQLIEFLNDNFNNSKHIFHTIAIPINFYLLDHIENLKKDNNTKKLEKFVLR